MAHPCQLEHLTLVTVILLFFASILIFTCFAQYHNNISSKPWSSLNKYYTPFYLCMYIYKEHITKMSSCKWLLQITIVHIMIKLIKFWLYIYIIQKFKKYINKKWVIPSKIYFLGFKIIKIILNIESNFDQFDWKHKTYFETKKSTHVVINKWCGRIITILFWNIRIHEGLFFFEINTWRSFIFNSYCVSLTFTDTYTCKSHR